MSEPQYRFRDDEPVADPGVTVGSFGEQSNATAVRLEPGDEARDLIPHLERIRLVEVNFPVVGDGPGDSAARILREAGYTGELRAVGEVLVDQIAFMRRCGFDAFAPDVPLDPTDAENAFGRYAEVYQPTTDGRTPIWGLRHGVGRHG